MEATTGTGIFLANSLGVVVTSALSYLWTAAAAAIRPQPTPVTRSSTTPPDNLDDVCDLWLHECASSSADGTFTHAKEDICTMAAPERCSQYFERKLKNPTPSSLLSYYRTRQAPTTPGRCSAETIEFASGVSMTTDRLWPSARRHAPQLGIILGWNTLGWISAYLVCRAVTKERARRLLSARIARDAAAAASAVVAAAAAAAAATAGGNHVGVGVNGAGGAPKEAVVNAPVVTDTAAGGSEAGVSGSGAENVAGVEIEQSLPQAPVAPGSVLRRDGNPNSDGDPAGGDYSSNNINNSNNNNEPGDSNSNYKPGGSSSVSSGGGSRSYLKPCSAVSPGSSLSAPLCGMSPHRMAPSPSKSRPPFSQDIHAATKKVPPLVARFRSQSDTLGGKAREMSGKGLTRRHSFPFAIGEGTANQERMGLAAQAGGGRGFNMVFAATSSAAPSPGLASPPKLRGARGFNRAALLAAPEASSPGLASPPRLRCAKAGGGPSAAQVKPDQSGSPSKDRAGDKDAVILDSTMVSTEANEDVKHRLNPANASSGAKLTGVDRRLNKEGGRDMKSTLPASASPAAGSRSAPPAPTSSTAKALGEGNRLMGIGATQDPVRTSGATNRGSRTFSEAERDLRILVGLGPPSVSTPPANNPPVAGSEGWPSHSSAPAPDTPGPQASGPGVPNSYPPILQSLFPGGASSSSSSTNSGCWVGLPEGVDRSTSLRGLSDLDVGVASSAGWGGALTQHISDVGGNGGSSPHDGGQSMSTHEILQQEGVEKAKGDNAVEPRASWAPPIGIDIDRLGFDSFLLAEDSEDGQPRSDGIGGGDPEEKGASAYQMSSEVNEGMLEACVRSDSIMGGVAEKKGPSTNSTTSPRRASPSSSTSRPPFPQDLSDAKKAPSPVRSSSQSDFGGKAREVSGKGQSHGPRVPFTVDEGKAAAKRRGLAAQARNARSFNRAAEVTALPASSPGFVSPPLLRNAKVAGDPPGLGGAVTRDTDGGNGGSPHDDQMFFHNTLQGGLEETKGGSVEPRASWAPPTGVEVDRLGFESFFLAANSDDGHPRADCVGRGGVVEGKGSPAYQTISFTEQARDIEANMLSNAIGGGFAAEKWSSAQQASPVERKRELETHAGYSRIIGGGAAGENGTFGLQISLAEKERELKVVLGLTAASPNAHLTTVESEQPRSPASPREPRWRNTSTRVPLEERQRRNQELFDAVQRRRETGTEEEGRVEAQPAPFPDESTWPSGGGYAEWEGPGDRLPPPSDYEVQEVARMNAIRDEAMREFGLEF